MSATNSSYLFLLMICVCITTAKPRIHLTYIVGYEVKLSCDLQTDPEDKIVWKAGPRVLFAGDLRIRRDRRLSLDNNDLVISRVGGGDGGEYSCETETLGGDVLMMITYGTHAPGITSHVKYPGAFLNECSVWYFLGYLLFI